MTLDNLVRSAQELKAVRGVLPSCTLHDDGVDDFSIIFSMEFIPLVTMLLNPFIMFTSSFSKFLSVEQHTEVVRERETITEAFNLIKTTP